MSHFHDQPFSRDRKREIKSQFHLRMSRTDIICSQTQLDDIAHMQTIICRQLFAGYVYVVGSRLMKKEEKFASNYNNSFSETSSTSFENNASKFTYFSAAEFFGNAELQPVSNPLKQIIPG